MKFYPRPVAVFLHHTQTVIKSLLSLDALHWYIYSRCEIISLLLSLFPYQTHYNHKISSISNCIPPSDPLKQWNHTLTCNCIFLPVTVYPYLYLFSPIRPTTASRKPSSWGHPRPWARWEPPSPANRRPLTSTPSRGSCTLVMTRILNRWVQNICCWGAHA